MATPTMTITVELAGSAIPSAAHTRGELRLVTSDEHRRVLAATTGGGAVGTSPIMERPDEDGLITFTNVRPNSGSSNDVIISPADTVYELTVVFPDRRGDQMYFTVPDTAGTFDITDHITVPPEDLGSVNLDIKADTDAGNIDPTDWTTALDLGTAAFVDSGDFVALGDDGALAAPKAKPAGSNQYANRGWSVALDNRDTTPARHVILTHSFGDYYFDDGDGETPDLLAYAAVYERESAKQLGATYPRGRGMLVGSYPAELFYPVGAEVDATTGTPNTARGAWGHAVDLSNNEYVSVTAECDGVIVGYTAKRSNGGTANIRDHTASSTVGTITGTDGTIPASPGYSSGRIATAAFTSFASREIRVVGSDGSDDVTIDFVYPTYGNRLSGLQVFKLAKGGQGWTDFLTSTPTQQTIQNLDPQKVTVMLLHNDASSAGHGLTSAQCLTVLTNGVALLRTLVDEGTTIEIAFEPGTDVTPATWGTEYREMVRQFCADDGDIQFTDMYEALGQYDDTTDPLLLATFDHIHPQKKAHARMARVLVDSSLTGTAPDPYAQVAADTLDMGGNTVDNVAAPFQVDAPSGGSVRLEELSSAPIVSVYGNGLGTRSSAIGVFGGLGLIGLGDGTSAPQWGMIYSGSGASANMLGGKITNSGDATAATDLVNRQSGDARWAQLSGATFTGAVSNTNGTDEVTDGTASHGKTRLTVSALGAGLLVYGNSSDTQAKASLTAAGGLALGAGGSSGTDWALNRTGSASATITGTLVTATTTIGGTMTFSDGVNIDFGSTTGTIVGGTGDKIGFLGATAVARPAATDDLRTALINLGLYTTGGASPLNLNGGALTAAAGTFSGTLANTSGQTDVTDGTASHGKVRASVSAFGAGLLVYGDSTDTQAKASLLPTSLGFGPGGSSGSDWTLTRTGVGVVQAAGVVEVLAGGTTYTRIGGVLQTQTTAVGNVSTGEDDIAAYTLPAGTMTANGDVVELEASGTVANNANAKTLRAKLGTTNLCAITLTTGAAYDWCLRVRVFRTSATGQKAQVEFISGNATANALLPFDRLTAAETLANALAFKVTADATSNDDVQCTEATWRFYPAK